MGFFKDLKGDSKQAGDEPILADIPMTAEKPEFNGNEEFSVDVAALGAMIDESASVKETPVVENPHKQEVLDVQAEASKALPPTGDITDISKDTSITGNIESEGSVNVHGKITGNITCREKLVVTGRVIGTLNANEIFTNDAKIDGDVSSDGIVKIGSGSVVVGNIYAQSAVIGGAIKGDIDVKGLVIVDSTAVVKGNIKSRSVQINNGAVVEGFCSQCYATVDCKALFAEKFDDGDLAAEDLVAEDSVTENIVTEESVAEESVSENLVSDGLSIDYLVTKELASDETVLEDAMLEDISLDDITLDNILSDETEERE